MEKLRKSGRSLGLFVGSLLILAGHAVAGDSIHSQLPPEVNINRNAGRAA